MTKSAQLEVAKIDLKINSHRIEYGANGCDGEMATIWRDVTLNRHVFWAFYGGGS